MGGQCLYIVNWNERYEVNANGAAWKPDQKFRPGPLEYLRCPIRAPKWSESYRNFLSVAKRNAPAALGVFQKLLEIAGSRPGGQRGFILDHHDNPADAKKIAEMLGFPVQAVRKSLEILLSPEVAWVKWGELGTSGGNWGQVGCLNNDNRKETKEKDKDKPKPKGPQVAPSTTPKKRGGDPTPVSADLDNAMDEITKERFFNDMLDRLMAVSLDPPHYREWWGKVIQKCLDCRDADGALFQAVEYAECCADKIIRRAKDLGELKKPGAYIAKKVGEALGENGISLPAKPKGSK